MGTIKEVALVAAPAERVWQAVVDFEARPRWSPRVKAARIVGGGPLQVGSRIRLKVDRDQFTSTVVEMRPRERLVLLVKGPGFRVRHIYELYPDGEATKASITGEYGGLIGQLVVRLMRGSVQRDLIDEMEAICRASEAKRPQ
ncbi:MAG: SRPBCC family protein [Chloroflexi bacterium]|nr:SRPBCC family protein [Chloroflexota bacterium]